jgi:hypothetical protein
MAKSTKTRVLTHWFGIDQILFGKPAKEVLKDDVLTQYLTTKGALLSNLFEIYNKLGYTPGSKFKTVEEMSAFAIKEAIESVKKATTILKEESTIKLVKQEIKEMGSLENLTEEQVSKFVIRKRRDSVAIDSLLLESVIGKENLKKLTDWQGKVLVDAHKALRDSLVEIALG